MPLGNPVAENPTEAPYMFVAGLRRVPAAASRVIVLKQCLGLPTPLWKEVLALMGGKYTQMARQPEY